MTPRFPRRAPLNTHLSWRASPRGCFGFVTGTRMHMRDVLVVVDVINNFAHDDGGALLESFRSRLDGIRSALVDARASGTPVVYVNDTMGRWDGQALFSGRSKLGLGLMSSLRWRLGSRTAFCSKPATQHLITPPSTCFLPNSSASESFSAVLRPRAVSCKRDSMGVSTDGK
jgi:hypothetical protein